MASFDENGKYIKTNWKAGDKITATKLNKIEESIEAVNDNDISRHVEADARLDALEAKDVAHEKELTNIKNTIADNKAAAELGDYEINSRMTFLENELNEGIEEVHNVASTVDGKIAQGKADMEAMVAEVEADLEADLEGLHAKDNELSEQLGHVENKLEQINLFIKDFKLENEESYTNAIKRAIDELPTKGGKLIFPQSEVCIFSIDLTGNNKKIIFDGNNSTFESENGNYIVFMNNVNNDYGGSNIEFVNCTFTGRMNNINDDGSCEYGVKLLNTSGMVFDRCTFVYFTKAGFYGLFAQYCDFKYCYFSANITEGAYGVILDSIDGAHRTNECSFTRCRFFTNHHALGVFGCESTRIDNCTIQNNQSIDYSIIIGRNDMNNGVYGPTNTTMISPWFELNKGYCIKTNLDTNTTLINPFFATVGNKTMNINNPYSINIQNAVSMSSEDSIEFNVSVEDCSAIVAGHNMELTINKTSGKFALIEYNKNKNSNYDIINEIIGNSPRLILKENRKAGARDAGLLMYDGEGETFSMIQNMAGGCTTFKTGFGTVGYFTMNINNNDCYKFKHDRFQAPILKFADNESAKAALGVGYLYRLEDGTVKITY